MADSVNVFGEEWNYFVQFREVNEESKEGLRKAIDGVFGKTSQQGLPSLCIETLIPILEKVKSDDALCLALLQLMIPNEPLSDPSVIRLIMWFQSKYSNKDDCLYFTYWFLVCLKLGLINKQVVQNHFNSLLFLFLQDIRNDGLSHILVQVANENNVSTKLFNQLSSKYKRLDDLIKKKQAAVLLNHLYKVLPKYDTSQTGLNWKTVVKPHVLTVKDKQSSAILNRIILLNAPKQDKLDLSKMFKSLSNTEVEENEDCYFGLTPVYGKVSKPRITHLKNFDDVVKHYDKIVTPKNILSVVQCKCGPLYIKFLNKSTLDDIEEQISCILTGILNSQTHPAIQNDMFLKSLGLVQSKGYMSLISVSKFLKNYFIIWDGLKYRREIISLIPWLRFESHQDMVEIMSNLLNVYNTVDLECRLDILGALPTLYVNMMCVINTQGKQSNSNKLAAWMARDAENVLNSYLSIFENFVSVGLTYHKNGSAFLVAALRAYIKIFVCQDSYDFRVSDDSYSGYHFTLIPVALVLMSHSSLSLTVIDLLIQILSLYWDSREKIMPNLTEEYYQEYISTSNTIELYSKDTLKILFDGVDNGELDEMMVGSLLKDKDREEFEAVKGFPSHIKHFLSVTSHFATSHIIHVLATKMKINVSSIKPTKYPDILDYIAPKMSLNLKKLANKVEESKVEREQISPEEQ